MKTKTAKTLVFSALALFTLVGTYNAFVMNTQSQLSAQDAKAIRRLDESYGIVKQGRYLATEETKWQKLRGPAVAAAFKFKSTAPASAESYAPTNVVEAAVKEDLPLNLTEVTDGKGQNVQASGELMTKNGSIETLEVSLPEGRSLSVAYSEMSGNVFEYELEGQILSGMLYQVDETSYMLTLSNGPFEGYRMRFTTPKSEDQAETQDQILAESSEVKPGTFGI